MKKAFTLAEILITLGIIGVVAAMTIPTLVANYRILGRLWANWRQCLSNKFLQCTMEKF